MTSFLKVSPRLPVQDLRRTVDFYTKTLGFDAGDPWPADAPSFVIVARDEITVQFFLSSADPPPAEARPTLSFDVDDARAIHAALLGKVNIEWGPEVYWYGRREFAILDPDGYMLIFSEPTSDPPTCHDE
jgi:catechol 2,3-dioxygenase-like lactoylglutathione lyase family enzyme